MLLMTAWGCGPTAKAQYLYSALSGLPQLGKKELLSPVDDELEPCAELEPGARRRYGFEPLGAIQAGSSLEARPMLRGPVELQFDPIDRGNAGPFAEGP